MKSIRSNISNKCLEFQIHWQCTKSLISHIMSHIRHYYKRISNDMILLLVKPKNFVTAWLVNAAKTRSRHTKRALCLLSPRRPRLKNGAKVNFEFWTHNNFTSYFWIFVPTVIQNKNRPKFRKKNSWNHRVIINLNFKRLWLLCVLL